MLFFPGCQFASSSGRGTYDLLLTLDHVLQSSLDRDAEVRVVLLDFSAAFDRVNHSGLIYELKSVGVGGPVLSVLEQISLVTDNAGSVWTVAVVDGRMLCLVYLRVVSWDLFFFVLFNSDLSHVVDSQVYCYADDTTLMAPVQRPSLRAAVGDVLNDDLVKVVDCCE